MVDRELGKRRDAIKRETAECETGEGGFGGGTAGAAADTQSEAELTLTDPPHYQGQSGWSRNAFCAK